ncbi:hypothetical protein L3Q82_005190 [Scortum barcoo]|uniref:Uncharacterized protein n=1 Tax=Scortum barcoo TaxID=214431 RepID=A0ACB8VA27_9TELE|nr:hypothetical protein L3Q82_005190 [Scortum barcoo]
MQKKARHIAMPPDPTQPRKWTVCTASIWKTHMGLIRDASQQLRARVTLSEGSVTSDGSDAISHVADAPSQRAETEISSCTEETCRGEMLKQTDTDRSRPHPCQKCEKSFSRICSLRRHELSHTAEKLYHCSSCPRHITDKQNRVYEVSGQTNHPPVFLPQAQRVASLQTLPPALPGDPEAFPGQSERHSLSSVSWVFPEASSRWDTPGTPP